MTHRKLITTAALIACAALALVGCQPYPPTEPSQTTVNQNVNITVGQPGASPSPGAGGTVTRVGIGKVSESCPANVAPSGRGDAVKVGCEAFLTCSPYAGNQELFDPAVIGAAPERFDQVSGQDFAAFAQRSSNLFNGDARGVKAGTATYLCTVRGITSPPFSLAVVQ